MLLSISFDREVQIAVDRTRDWILTVRNVVTGNCDLRRSNGGNRPLSRRRATYICEKQLESKMSSGKEMATQQN